jgi:predicted RNA methylase
MLAAQYAQKVIALESDDICVDIVEQQIQANKQKGIHTLVIDLAETASNLGALNKEFSSILDHTNIRVYLY